MAKKLSNVIHCYDNEEMVIHALRVLQRKHAFPRDVLVYMFQVYLAMATPVGWDEETLTQFSNSYRTKNNYSNCRCFREVLTGGGKVFESACGYLVSSLLANRSIVFPSKSSHLKHGSFPAPRRFGQSNERGEKCTVAVGGVTEIELVLRAGERDQFSLGLLSLEHYLQLTPETAHNIDALLHVRDNGLLFISSPYNYSSARWAGEEGDPTFCPKQCRAALEGEILLIRIDARPHVRKLSIASRRTERFSPREELLGHSYVNFAESVPVVPVVAIRTNLDFDMRLISYKYLPNG